MRFGTIAPGQEREIMETKCTARLGSLQSPCCGDLGEIPLLHLDCPGGKRNQSQAVGDDQKSNAGGIDVPEKTR
jgi:hypothetical protein